MDRLGLLCVPMQCCRLAVSRSQHYTPAYGLGVPCGEVNDRETCAIADIGDVDCLLSAWTEWGPCSVVCGGGSQARYRTVVSEAQGRGVVCAAQLLVEEQVCGSKLCSPNLECLLGDLRSWAANFSEAVPICGELGAGDINHPCQRCRPCGMQICNDLPANQVTDSTNWYCSCDSSLGYEGTSDIYGRGCTDIDACKAFPCSEFSSTGCTDLPAPAHNDSAAGRVCGPCRQGYTGDGIDCEKNLVVDCNDGTYCNNPGGVCFQFLSSEPECSPRTTESACLQGDMCGWDPTTSSAGLCRKLACGERGAYKRFKCDSTCSRCTGPSSADCSTSSRSSSPVVSGVAAGGAIGGILLIIIVVLIVRRSRKGKTTTVKLVEPSEPRSVELDFIKKGKFERREMRTEQEYLEKKDEMICMDVEKVVMKENLTKNLKKKKSKGYQCQFLNN